MKKLIRFAGFFGILLFSLRTWAQPEIPQDNPPPNPPSQYYQEEKLSGWFVGSDQGVLFFVGKNSNLIGTQYYGTLFGGYNIKGIFQPMLRLGQAVGTMNGIFYPTTFFFTVEGAFKVTPLARSRFSPYFLGSAGLYILSFDNFGFLINDEANFTYTGGGGLEIRLGQSNRITLGSEYRGFVNSGANFQGVTVSLGYAFQF